MYGGHDEGPEDEFTRGVRRKGGSYGARVDAYRILAVTSDEKLIALTSLSLAKIGLKVEAATTAYEALIKLPSSRHPAPPP